VKNGQKVTKGQVVAKLDDSQYQINLQQAQAALELAQATYSKLPDDVQSANAAVEKAQTAITAADAQYKTAQMTLADAKRQLDHNKALFDSGAISKEALDAAQSNYDRAAMAVEAADANKKSNNAALADAQTKVNSLNNSQAAIYTAQIKQAQSTYNNAKLAEDNTVIKAEISGTVLRIPVTAGENIIVDQTILTISDLDGAWINANIDEKKSDRVKLGQKVDVRIDAYPGRVFSGKVFEVGNSTQSIFNLIATDNSSGNFTKVTQRLPVKIKVLDKGVVLKPGTSAVVTIHTN
jgi:multidrug resistance efflux pump